MFPHRYRIGLCADLHFWHNNAYQFGGEGSLQLQPCSDLLLAELLTQLEKAQVDMVIHLGDVTCGGGYFDMPRADFYNTLKLVHKEFERLPQPIYALPGNHDCPPGGGNWAFFEQLWGLTAGTGATVDLPNARLILLNTQGHRQDQIELARPTDPVYGWVNELELLRLEDALATAGDRPVLLFCHQLLRPWTGAHNPWAPHFFGVRNSASVLEIMARYSNVRAVFQAHAHRFDVHQTLLGKRNCHFVVIPALIEFPLAWMSLELTASQAQLHLQQLPLPELVQLSKQSGDGQAWRLGKPIWGDIEIDLRS